MLHGTLEIIVRMLPEEFHENKIPFLRYLSDVLSSNLMIQREENTGNEMIYAYEKDDISGTIVTLKIDVRHCEDEGYCYENVASVANQLAAYERLNPSMEFPIHQVLERDRFTPNNLMVTLIVAIVGVASLAIFIVLVVTRNPRKRARGTTWFPEGFTAFSSSKPQIADPCNQSIGGGSSQEMHNFGQIPSHLPELNISTDSCGNLALPFSFSQSDDEDLPPTKRCRKNPSEAGHNPEFADDDPRQWTQQHLDAADIRNPDGIELTPPQHEQEDPRTASRGVDPRGPMGLTPLMIASFRGGGLEGYTDKEDEDSSTQVINELIEQGAKLNATMDRTGETSLHLAAR